LISLSTADFACADAWLLPPGIRERAIQKFGPALVEARCMGEDLESLALGIIAHEGVVQAVALSQTEFDEIRKAAAGFDLALITSVPSLLTQTFGTLSFTQGGERIECSRDEKGIAWRSFPKDAPDEEGTLVSRGLEVSYGQAAAFAAAVADLDTLPNVLDSTSDRKHAWVRTLRDPIANVAAALSLCLVGLGIHFHRTALQERVQLGSAREAESQLGRRYLPGQEIPEGRLLRLVNERVADIDAPGGVGIPSALAFWDEIGKQFPDVNALGLTLESLDLAPDGGRLSSRVPAGKEDPLKNASDLEGQLNKSRKLSARGDYEVKDREVQVRLRMDYRP
jgi:hypothetical protein